MKVPKAGRIISMAVLIAVGVNTDGRREVLGVATGLAEAEPFWKAFLRQLADRGRRGVQLVIADDHKGLRAAAAKVFHASHQRCRVHWMRNALAHVPPKQRPAVWRCSRPPSPRTLWLHVEDDVPIHEVGGARRAEALEMGWGGDDESRPFQTANSRKSASASRKSRDVTRVPVHVGV